MRKHSVRLIRNFGVLFSANVAAQLLQLVALVHLARVLGPSSFGHWGVASAWMLSLLRLGEMGLEVIGIRTIAAHPEAVRPAAADVVAVRLGISLVVLACIAAGDAAGVFPPGIGPLVLVLSLSLVPSAVSLEWVFEAHQRVTPVGIARLVRGVAFLLPVLVFVQGEEHLFAAAYLYAGSVLMASLVAGGMAVGRYPLIPPTADFKRAVRRLREAAPVGGATLLSQYSMFAGTILAGYLVSPEEVGLYTAAHRPLVFIWAYGIVTSNRVILPHLSSLYQSSPALFDGFVRKYFRLLVLLAVPIALVGATAGSSIVSAVYGEEFRPGGPVFAVLSLAITVAVGRSILELGLIASHRQEMVLRGMIGLAVLMTGASYAGFVWGGITGAAWGALLAESAYAAYLVGALRSIHIGDILAAVRMPAAVAALLASAAWLAGAESILVAAVALLAYVGSMVRTRQVSVGDFALLKEALGSSRQPEQQP